MKKTVKILSLIAFLAVIGFSIVIFSCEDEENVINFPPPLEPAHLVRQNFNDTSATEFVAGIKLGWNLGNTLDAGGQKNLTVAQMETGWGNPVTTEQNFITLKNKGFNTIRIPVSWYKTVDDDYSIREDWLIRVTEIVNYADKNNMYIILNTHHDTSIFRLMNTNVDAGLAAFEIIWKQIALQFRNYNEKLIFEALNEPRTPGSVSQWDGGTEEEQKNLNKYYDVFVKTVRNTGGNNNKRFLLINPYAASAESNAMRALVLPKDSADKKLIVSVHFYEPYNFALDPSSPVNTWDKNKASDIVPIYTRVDRANSLFISKGIPVIIGEFGAMNKENEEVRAQWAEYYVGYARGKGIPCVWWDNGVFEGTGEKFGILDRRSNTFKFESVVDALLKGAGVLP